MATIIVDTSVDENDGSIGDGLFSAAIEAFDEGFQHLMRNRARPATRSPLTGSG